MTQITKDNGGRSAKEIIASIVEETKLPCRIRTLLGLAMPGLRTLDRGRLVAGLWKHGGVALQAYLPSANLRACLSPSFGLTLIS